MADRKEQLAALIWLPVHLVILPRIFAALCSKGSLSLLTANFLVYLAGAVYMLILLHGSFRRGFDKLCDAPLQIFLQVTGSYLAIESINILLSMLLTGVLGDVNPNDAEIAAVSGGGYGMTAAAAVFLAPFAEEGMFRAGFFGILKDRNRKLAYAFNAIAFSLYHVLPYAMEDPRYLIFAAQYVPASILLCSCYEKTESIWTPVFLHMLVNWVSMKLLGSM